MAQGEPLFRALGPLEVWVEGGQVDLGPAKQRALLGVLLALAPDAVPVERLVDELWPAGGPGQPLRSLQVYVSALRRALGPEGSRLVTVGRAYRVEVLDAGLDITVFEDRVDEGPGAAPLRRARGRRGDRRRGTGPLEGAGVAGPARRAGARARRSTARDSAPDLRATRAAARLALGRHRADGPSWRTWCACTRSARTSVDTSCSPCTGPAARPRRSRRTPTGRRSLAAETGLDPGAALRDLHAAILARRPGAAARGRRPTGSPPPPRRRRRH